MDGGRNAHLAAFATFARFADGSAWFLTPPVYGKPLSAPSDPLRVSTTAVYLPSLECASLTNTSSREITRAKILFRHYATDGSVINEDTLDVTLALRPGESLAGNCKDIDITSVPDIFHYVTAMSEGSGNVLPPTIRYRGIPLSFGALVTQVDFADGTSWHESGT
ncbi:MAG: hypothetical protein ACYDGM_07390 [Vulcanimicrobiaceae bacterium]